MSEFPISPAASADGGRKLRVVVVTEDDPVYVREFFDVFFDGLAPSLLDVRAVVVCKAFHESLPATARRVFRFFGPVDFSRLLPRYLFAKFASRDIGSLALAHGLRVIRPESVNSHEFVEQVRGEKPDVIVSVAAPEIFKSPLLSVPTIGCLNIHSGELPAYRGMMPTFWQMLEGREHVTVTIHEMVPKLDAGGVVATREFPISGSDSLDRVIRGTKQAGARLMLSVLADIASSRALPPATPLDMSKARLFRFPGPEDVARFRARGHRIF